MSARARASSLAKAARPLRVSVKMDRRASCRRLASLDEPALLERAEHAAEVPGVEAEQLPDHRRGRVARVRELIQHANLAKREIALQSGCRRERRSRECRSD